MHASAADSRSLDFSTDFGHSSSGSLRGIYSDTEYTDLDTHTTNTSPLGQSSAYDPTNGTRKLSMASAGSESLFSSRKGDDSSNPRKHRPASSARKLKLEERFKKHAKDENVRSAPPTVDMSESGEGGETSAAPLALVPEEVQTSNRCIVR